MIPAYWFSPVKYKSIVCGKSNLSNTLSYRGRRNCVYEYRVSKTESRGYNLNQHNINKYIKFNVRLNIVLGHYVTLHIIITCDVNMPVVIILRIREIWWIIQMHAVHLQRHLCLDRVILRSPDSSSWLRLKCIPISVENVIALRYYYFYYTYHQVRV